MLHIQSAHHIVISAITGHDLLPVLLLSPDLGWQSWNGRATLVGCVRGQVDLACTSERDTQAFWSYHMPHTHTLSHTHRSTTQSISGRVKWIVTLATVMKWCQQPTVFLYSKLTEGLRVLFLSSVVITTWKESCSTFLVSAFLVFTFLIIRLLGSIKQ